VPETPKRTLWDKLLAHLGSNLSFPTCENQTRKFSWMISKWSSPSYFTSTFSTSYSSSCSWFIQSFYSIYFLVDYLFFFFTLTLFCLPLFRRLHSSGKHLLRVYPADANNSNHLAPCSPPIWSSTIETFKHNEITNVALCINWLGTGMREKEVLADVHTTRWSRGS